MYIYIAPRTSDSHAIDDLSNHNPGVVITILQSWNHDMPLLSLKNLSKLVGDRYLFRDLTFDVDEGEIVCLSAPSGFGKTTVLKVLETDHPKIILS